MTEKVNKLRHSGIFVKTFHSNSYIPTTPSSEAKICLKCEKEYCTGTCKRYKEERAKLKEKLCQRKTS